MKKKILLLCILSLTVFQLVNAQKTIYKDTKEISFSPKLKKGDKLKYLMELFKVAPGENNLLDTIAITYKMNVYVTSVSDSILKYDVTVSEFDDKLSNYLFKNLKLNMKYNFNSRENTLTNSKFDLELIDDEDFEKLISSQLANNQQLSKEEEIEYIKNFTSNRISNLILRDTDRIFYGYNEKLPFKRTKTDTTENKDLLGLNAKFVFKRETIKDKKSYVYSSSNNMLKNDNFTKMISEQTDEAIKKEFGEDAKVVPSENPVETSLEQTIQRKHTLKFNKKTGILEYFNKQSRQSITGVVDVIIKRTFTLLKD
ncbi:hypothetical protein [Aureivirga sp. CE67]|uniref:hypothetical protein n=1 Tax=Aureivirga sp. CE67 TaxID=1788983 RepID=UPI0018C9AD69|nr:hypothetical protein [Aureivirga sp. CE67]